MTGPKLLIVGFGSMGKLHAKYAAMLDIDWWWQDMDPDAGPPERRRDEGPQYRIERHPHHFTHVIIATPASTHGDVLRDFNFSGAPMKFLVEKPGVTDMDDLDLLKSDHVSVGLVERFNPAFQTLKGRVSPGRVLSIDFIRCSARPVSRIKESSFIDVGMHDIDLLLQMFGDDAIKTVSARRNGNTFCMTATLSEGQIARFIWSNETFHKEREVRVRQTDCNFVCDLIEQTVRRYSLSEGNKNVVESIYVEKASPLLQEMKEFISGKRIDGVASNRKFLELQEMMR